MTANEEKSLGFTNYMNLLAFIVNAVFTFIIGWFVVPYSNGELSRKYTTIITPSGAAFSIWGVIFLLEGIFAVAQMTPAYRDHKLVHAVMPFWVLACGTQSAWTMFFGYDQILYSLYPMVGIWLSLALLILRADFVQGVGPIDELVLMSGFGLHTGWITCATFLNVNVFFVLSRATQAVQISIAIVSLATIFAIAGVYACGLLNRPSFLIPLVVSWASYWIMMELEEAKTLTDSSREFYVEFDDSVIEGFRFAATILAFGGAAMVVAAILKRFFTTINRRCCASGKAETQQNLLVDYEG